MTSPADSSSVLSGVDAVDTYLSRGFATVPGMSSRFAAAITAGLMRIQTGLGVSGPIAEIGTFEGRFYIALAKALQPGEMALGMDIFDWPNPQVVDRFEANCIKHGVAEAVRKTWKCDSRAVTPAQFLEHTGGRRVRLFAFTVQIQHMPADGHGGMAAVIQQLIPGRVAVLGRVLTEGDKQIRGMARRNPCGGEAGAQGHGAG